MNEYKIDKIFDEYLKGIQKFYPALRFSGRFSLFAGDEPSGGEFTLGSDENVLKGTDHLIESKNLQIVHFTSLKAGLSIIEKGELWLSQVDKCNDANELIFAHSSLSDEFKSNLMKERKRYFLSSFSDYTCLSEEDEFMLWRCYGNDGKGLALVFEVENPNEVAETYLFGKVVYGENSKALEHFKSFLSFDSEFRKKHPVLIHNKSFTEILMISLLLKTLIWKNENEIRLIGYHNFAKYDLTTKHHDLKNSILSEIYHTIGEDAKHRAYLKLPLYSTPKYLEMENKLNSISTNYSINNLLPAFRLKKVLLGYRISKNYFSEMEQVFHNMLSSYADKPSIENSRMYKYF
jgi:hypothetical protein